MNGSKKTIILVYLRFKSPGFIERSRNSAGAKMKVVPKLGMMYISAVLRKAGYNTEIWDQDLTDFTPDKLVSRVKRGDVLFLGYYASTFHHDVLEEEFRGIRAKGISAPIVIGGPGVLEGEGYLKAGGDYIVYGEGEETVVEVARRIEEGTGMEGVLGTAYMKQGEYFIEPPRPLIKDLDTLPFPDRDSISPYEYYDYHMPIIRKPYSHIIASRGCPYNCTFCATHFTNGKHYRTRSPENVLQEIDLLVNKYGIKYIAFKDNILGFNKRWLREFCEGLIRRDYDLSLHCYIAPFQFKDELEEYIGLLKRAGFKGVSVGLQSVDADILRSVRRSPKEPEAVKEIVRVCREKGVLTIVSFIVGLPGETYETNRKLREYLKKYPPDFLELTNFVFLEGSELHRKHGYEWQTEISKEETLKLVKKTNIEFYLNPRTILRTAKIIAASKNAEWALFMARNLHLFIAAVGASDRRSLKILGQNAYETLANRFKRSSETI